MESFDLYLYYIFRAILVEKPKVENQGEFLKGIVSSQLPLLVQSKDTNKIVGIALSSVQLISDSREGTEAENQVLSNLTDSISALDPSSLETIDQLSDTLKSTVSLMSESSLSDSSRALLTASLEKMVYQVEKYANDSVLASRESLSSILFLISNNLAAYGLPLTRTGPQNRKRRSILANSFPQTNQNLIIKLYFSILRGSLKGEQPQQFSTKYGSVQLKRFASNSLSKELGADGCSVVINSQIFKKPYPDVFQIFNTSFLPNLFVPVNKSHLTANSVICGLDYYTPSTAQIPVYNVSDEGPIMITLNNTLKQPHPISVSNTVVQPQEFVDGTLLLQMNISNASTVHIVITLQNIGGGNVDHEVYLKANKAPMDGDNSSLLPAQNNGQMIKKVFGPR